MSAEGRSNVQGNEQLTAGHDMDGHGVNRLGRSRAQFSGGLWLSWDGGSFSPLPTRICSCLYAERSVLGKEGGHGSLPLSFQSARGPGREQLSY